MRRNLPPHLFSTRVGGAAHENDDPVPWKNTSPRTRARRETAMNERVTVRGTRIEALVAQDPSRENAQGS